MANSSYSPYLKSNSTEFASYCTYILSYYEHNAEVSYSQVYIALVLRIVAILEADKI